MYMDNGGSIHHGYNGAPHWRLGMVLTSESECCGVESWLCLGSTGMFLQCTITELSKAMVFGSLSMGHIKDPLPFFEKKSRVVIWVAGFPLYHLIDSITND